MNVIQIVFFRIRVCVIYAIHNLCIYVSMLREKSEGGSDKEWVPNKIAYVWVGIRTNNPPFTRNSSAQ